jgi:hypothetical protein
VSLRRNRQFREKQQSKSQCKSKSNRHTSL